MDFFSSKQFQTVGGDVGDGYCRHAVYLDQEVFVLLDAFDDSFDALETAGCNADVTTHVGGVSNVKKNDRVVLGGCDPHEVLHLTVRNVKQFFVSLGGGLRHVPHGVKFFPVHFQMG